MRRLVLSLLASAAIGTGATSLAAQAPTADAVLTAARAALGGEKRIAELKTFIATGRTRQVRGDNLVPIEFEIQVELPDKYSRRDEFPQQDQGPVTAGFAGDALVLMPRPPTAPEAMLRSRLTTAQHDFARLMLGMFAGTPASFPLTYTLAGQAEAPQGKADVLDVKGPNNFAARLFIAGDTRLPIMLTWSAPAPPGPPGAAPKPAPEQRMFFADYRDVNGHKFPFRIRRGTGAETTEETTFDRFRLNARVDPRRFETAGQ
jgi:hypothetical protein